MLMGGEPYCAPIAAGPRRGGGDDGGARPVAAALRRGRRIRGPSADTEESRRVLRV